MSWGEPLSALVGRRLLAVDLGARYTGLAVHRSPLLGAQPYGLVERMPRERRGGGLLWLLKVLAGGERPPASKRFGTQGDALLAVIRTEGIGGVVFGMPFGKDGSRGAACSRTEAHVRRLCASWRSEIPVVLWDESWSTRLAVGAQPRLSQSDAAWAHAASARVVLQEVIGALHSREVCRTDTEDGLH